VGRVRDRQMPLDVFVGRAAELAQMADILARVEAGQPWLVAIEGEPGVGKSTLARRFLAQASGLKILSARADQYETALNFGVVDQLLRGIGEAVPTIPSADGTAPAASSFAVGAHMLEIVGAQQTTGAVALVIDDLQWADRRSAEALTFMLRRLSVDPVLAVVTYRGPSSRLDEAAQRLLQSAENRAMVPLGGLGRDEVATLAASLDVGSLDSDAVEWLYQGTGGHPLYLRTVLGDPAGLDLRAPGRRALPRSLAAVVGGHLRALPSETRSILELLSVLNVRTPLAQLGQVAQVDSPGALIEPAVAAGLVGWWPDEPTCPVEIRHQLVRDAIYAGISASQRRVLHARAAVMVSQAASWEHRVAALDRPDEALAAELERLAGEEANDDHVALAATHLRWASDISPERVNRERRLLTAALYLADDAQAAALRPAVEAATPSPLRGFVLGAIMEADGQLTEAERCYSEALAEARDDPDSLPLAARIAARQAGTYTLRGEGDKTVALGQWALDTGCLDPAAASQTRSRVAIGVSQTGGPRKALAELGRPDADPHRVRPSDVDRLAWRGLFSMLAGDLGQAVTDLTASLKVVRRGAALALGQRPHSYLVLAQYLAGQWDDALLAAEQALSAAAIHSYRHELPLLHLALGCVPAGRGVAEAERHARLAEEIAASLDYAQERPYAAMARALICQAAGDYLGMADALGYWSDASALDGRSRRDSALWRPLLAEGLIGSGQTESAVAVMAQLRSDNGQVGYLQPALAWLEGGLAELQGRPEEAHRIYQSGEDTASTQSPFYMARLLLAHGRLLRRVGQRRLAIERLRRAKDLLVALRAVPFIGQADEELAACDLPADPVSHQQGAAALTSRETEVAHLVGKGMSNPEIAAELFISRKAVEYHLGNIYAKFGMRGRKQLRTFVAGWRQPATI
jgi:DNA-binding CsgD family transcriptional regulator